LVSDLDGARWSLICCWAYNWGQATAAACI